MKFKLILILLILSSLQLHSQIEPNGSNDPNKCRGFEAEVTSINCIKKLGTTVTIFVSGGTPPYSTPGSAIQIGAQGNFVIEGLGTGTYTETFTDSNGCEVEVTFEVPICDFCIDFNAIVTSQTCAPDGTVFFNVTGGTPPYTSSSAAVEFSPGNFVLEGVQLGSQTISFSDSNGCLVEVSFSLPECQTCVDFEAELISLTCTPNGTANIFVSGGTPPYATSGTGEEMITTGNFVIQGISEGNHTETFTDSEGCEVQVTFDIYSCTCTIEAELASVSCGGPNGSANIIVSGGTIPYTNTGNGQQLNTGNFVFDGLDSGNFTETFLDANGCGVDVTFSIPDCGCSDFEAELTKLNCGPNGTTYIQVSGGTPPYTTSGSGQEMFITGNFIIQGMTSGTHTETFMDSQGCEVDITFFMPECGCEDLIAEVTNLTCGPSGSVNIFVSGGSPPYSTSGSATQSGTQGNFFIQDLAIGTYTETFTDSDGCEVDVFFTIHENDLEASVVSNGCAPEGTAWVQITGGSPPYSGPSGSISYPEGYIAIQGLESGIHTLTFLDSKGCDVNAVINVEDAYTCDDFLDIYYDISMGSEFQVTSGIWANINVAFWGHCIPDQLIVTVDGVEVVNITAGSAPCDGDFECDAIELGHPDQFTCAQFCVSPCSVVNFTVIQDYCEPVIDCGTTWWNIYVTGCGILPPNITSSLHDDNPCADQLSIEYRSNTIPFNPGSQISDRPVEGTRKIFPNPVNEILHISDSNSTLTYQSLRVLDTRGNVILNTTSIDSNNLEIDVSSYPSGIYLLELIDMYGQKSIEKFTKL